ncbi:unnamed protein product [Nyctereutes procyonoides]|uniref:(raccoon dog) hypothetical protein n=1 Tax=Nyctereutes procyonoides TaxID=34880 RepID=A0A811ZGF8_NYCPR|nr:unnamed protein product [Nyctereutes procyonoides]
MPAHQWSVMGNCAGFLVRRNKQTYSTEPSPEGSQLFLQQWADSLQNCGYGAAGGGWGADPPQQKPTTSYMQTTINKDAGANIYSPDLFMATICRASAILCSQKLVMVKRKEALPHQELLSTCPPTSKAVKISTT